MSEKKQIWREALVSPKTLLKDVIGNLDKTALQISLVASDNDVLLGTITDGDIRRAILSGKTMEATARDVMNASPLVAPIDMDIKLAHDLMNANYVAQLPVVDENKIISGLHLWRDAVEDDSHILRDNILIVMAGGLGTRLRPYTENCPKPMLPVGDKPMLEHILLRAKSDGFRHFVFSIRYLGHMIEEYFGDGSAWGVNINYIKENDPLGTAGALSLLESKPSDPVVVTNGDVLSDIRYSEMLSFHEDHESFATMAVRQHEWQHPYGVVRTDGVDIIGFDEKPIHKTHINAGIYVLSPESLNLIESNKHCDMPTLFRRLQALNKKNIVFPMHESWLDVGRPDDLIAARSNSDQQEKVLNSD